MGEKNLLDLIDVVIDPPFIKEVMVYPNNGKLKPLPIGLYEKIKDLIDHVQMFQPYMHYGGAPDVIMCWAILTTFLLATQDCYATLKPNSIGLFKDFAHKFISHFTSSYKFKKIAINLLEIQ